MSAIDQQITYIPYRGEKEKVTKVHIATIVMTRDFIEVTLAYDFNNEKGEDDFMKIATLMPRATLVLTRALLEREDEVPGDSDAVEGVMLECPGTRPMYIKVKESDEANKIYQQIRRWMLKL